MSETKPCRDWSRRIEALWLKGKSRHESAIMEHVAGCAACRELYDRLSTVDLALQADRPLSLFAIDRIERRVVPPAKRPLLWPAAVSAVGAVAALASLLVVSLRTPEYRGRGEIARPAAEVSLWCIADGPGGPQISGKLPLGSSGELRCGLRDHLQISYVRHGSAARSLVVEAIPQVGAPVRLAPAGAAEAPVVLSAGGLEQVLPFSVQLTDHGAGGYDVRALIGGGPPLELKGRLILEER